VKQKPVHSTVKVGLLTLIALTVLVSTVIWLRGRGVTGGQHFEIYFNDVDGMRVGAPVQYMGMRVGFVDEMKPLMIGDNQYVVLVKFTINEPDLQLPKGATLSIQQSGFIGEKFLEVTPPRLRTITLRTEKPISGLAIGTPIIAEFQDGLAQIGVVKKVNFTRSVDLSDPEALYAYKLAYWITQPGLDLPELVDFSIQSNAAGTVQLRVVDPHFLLVKRPVEGSAFSVQDPLRIKTFLEKQLASASALQQTNEKINTLMSEQTIESIQAAVKNTELLTVKANQVLTHGDQLFVAAKQDLNSVVKSANQLSSSISQLSQNVNDVAGDPKFKSDLKKAVANIERSTNTLSDVIESSELKGILADTKVTSENAAEVMARLRQAMIEEKLPEKVDKSITELNRSLDSLSSVLSQLDDAASEDDNLKKIVGNTRKTSDNLRQFSQKLNKHFLLFRLLF
jgi:phospholipid/cholesterol/gamma-HCH transport system substrate-binding protein